MKDKTNMDKLVRDKLDNFTVAPPSHVWGNIQGQLAAERRKKRRMFVAWVSAAAVVVFAFMAGWYINGRSGQPIPVEPENHFTQQNIQKEIQKESKEIPTENNLKIPVKDIEHINIAEATSVEESKKSSHVVTNNRNENRITETVEKMRYQLLESLEAILPRNQEEIYLAENEKQKNSMELTETDKLLIAENLRFGEKQMQKETSWKVGAHLSAGYSSHSARYSKEYSTNMVYSDNTNSNMGGGVSVQYKTSKRLRFESGVYYSPNGQVSDKSSSGLFKFNSSNDLMYSAPEGISGDYSGFDTPVSVNAEGISMNTIAGVVNIDKSARGANITASAESADRAGNVFSSSGELSQVFEFIEVPLYARYSLVDKRFGIELMGGVNAGWLVGNNVYINNEYGEQRIGSTQDISTLNFAGTLGLGFNYKLGKHLSLAMEPRLNYYLRSISSNPDVNYRPYNVGIFTGVYYEF